MKHISSVLVVSFGLAFLPPAPLSAQNHDPESARGAASLDCASALDPDPDQAMATDLHEAGYSPEDAAALVRNLTMDVSVVEDNIVHQSALNQILERAIVLTLAVHMDARDRTGFRIVLEDMHSISDPAAAARARKVFDDIIANFLVELGDDEENLIERRKRAQQLGVSASYLAWLHQQMRQWAQTDFSEFRAYLEKTLFTASEQLIGQLMKHFAGPIRIVARTALRIGRPFPHHRFPAMVRTLVPREPALNPQELIQQGRTNFNDPVANIEHLLQFSNATVLGWQLTKHLGALSWSDLKAVLDDPKFPHLNSSLKKALIARKSLMDRCFKNFEQATKQQEQLKSLFEELPLFAALTALPSARNGLSAVDFENIRSTLRNIRNRITYFSRLDGIVPAIPEYRALLKNIFKNEDDEAALSADQYNKLLSDFLEDAHHFKYKTKGTEDQAAVEVNLIPDILKLFADHQRWYQPVSKSVYFLLQSIIELNASPQEARLLLAHPWQGPPQPLATLDAHLQLIEKIRSSAQQLKSEAERLLSELSKQAMDVP